ncbi:MAG: acetyl-CoA C-acyltransferase [Actinobacteria bacterium]|nr:acetyl-CoA C-acyltransferase [Actinomycetota bacterium]
MPEAVIVAIGRSPIGRAGKGALVNERPDNLGAYILDKVLEQIPAFDRTELEDVIAGCALPGGEQGHNLGRIVSMLARVNAPGCTVNRYCSSSLQAVRMAFHAIKAGEGDAFAAVGIEMVTRSPLGVYADQPETINHRFDKGNAEGLPQAYMPMGLTAEKVADQEGITREDMDRFAVLSQERAVAAQKSGFFENEIIPVQLASGEMFTKDEGPREGTTMESLGGLRPVFSKTGRITAGNACPLNDGAAATIIMSDTRARELGLTPIAKILSTGVSALTPELMGLGPIDSTKQALSRAGLTANDIDILEINEAFAAQVIPSATGIGVDPFGDKLNPHGGAIALGHPFGMTGVRILATLLNGLKAKDKTIGVETMCVGGGQGMAIVVERLS